ncbi:MAG: HAD-IA family hydrolase [Myxococcales bacterium]|nr:HAD-IA family hydrolase [Myxococcales bacterium]
MLRALLLDMDGVLVDSYAAWFALTNDLARRLACPAIDPETFRRAWGQSVDDDARQFFPGHAADRIRALYEEHISAHLDHVRVDPAAARVFAVARAHRLATAVVTNTPRAMAAVILDGACLRPDVLVCGTDVAAAKPAPDMLLAACRQLRVATSEALMIGDSRFDRQAAAAASVRFVGLGIAGDMSIAGLSELLPLVAQTVDA